jgi:ADP-ribose pyrophosphatase
MTRSRAPRVLSRRLAFRGRVFHVDQERVLLSNGRQTTLDIVRHRGSVVLIPQPSAGQVILIRQYRHAIRRWIWELPAGSLERGEAPARAARRECEEEIGLTPARVRRLGTYFPTPGFCDERMIFYRCDRLKRPASPVAGDPDEQITSRVFSFDAAWRLVRRGRIVDLKTIVGLLTVSRPPTR